MPSWGEFQQIGEFVCLSGRMTSMFRPSKLQASSFKSQGFPYPLTCWAWRWILYVGLKLVTVAKFYPSDHLRGGPTPAHRPDRDPTTVRFPLLNAIPLRLPESKRVHLGIWTISWIKVKRPTRFYQSFPHHNAIPPPFLKLRHRHHTLSLSSLPNELNHAMVSLIDRRLPRDGVLECRM